MCAVATVIWLIFYNSSFCTRNICTVSSDHSKDDVKVEHRCTEFEFPACVSKCLCTCESVHSCRSCVDALCMQSSYLLKISLNAPFGKLPNIWPTIKAQHCK